MQDLNLAPSIAAINKQMLIAVIVLTAISCADQIPSRPNISQGQQVETENTPVAALLKPDILSDGLYVYCSGVLIAPHVVLTAAHCASTKDAENRTPIAYDPHDIRVQIGSLKANPDSTHLLEVKAIKIHPDYAPQNMGRDKDGLIKPSHANDLAILILKTPIANGLIEPTQIVEEKFTRIWLQNEQSARIFGYGLTDPWESGSAEPVLMHAETIYRPGFDKVVSRLETVNGRLIKRPVTVNISGYSEAEIFLGGNGHPDTCSGDSGGPAFIRVEDGSLKLLAITSRGDPQCEQGGVYTRVTAFKEWIEYASAP